MGSPERMFAHVQSLLGMDKILYHGDSLGRVMSDEKSEMRADTRDQAYWLSAYGGSQMPFTYSFEKGLGHSGTRRPASDFEDDLAQASRSRSASAEPVTEASSQHSLSRK